MLPTSSAGTVPMALSSRISRAIQTRQTGIATPLVSAFSKPKHLNLSTTEETVAITTRTALAVKSDSAYLDEWRLQKGYKTEDTEDVLHRTSKEQFENGTSELYQDKLADCGPDLIARRSSKSTCDTSSADRGPLELPRHKVSQTKLSPFALSITCLFLTCRIFLKLRSHLCYRSIDDAHEVNEVVLAAIAESHDMVDPCQQIMAELNNSFTFTVTLDCSAGRGRYQKACGDKRTECQAARTENRVLVRSWIFFCS